MLITYASVGIVALSSKLRPRAPASDAPISWRSEAFYQGLAREWASIPDICWGKPDSDFQQGRCEDIWLHLLQVTALGCLPLGVFFVLALFALDSLKLTYKRIRKKIGGAQYGIKATVTRPARVRGDLYAWFYCFHCISVELQDKTQLRVYLSPHENIPFPGDTVAIFQVGEFFGRKRYMATLYAPHVAVFAAVRGG